MSIEIFYGTTPPYIISTNTFIRAAGFSFTLNIFVRSLVQLSIKMIFILSLLIITKVSQKTRSV